MGYGLVVLLVIHGDVVGAADWGGGLGGVEGRRVARGEGVVRAAVEGGVLTARDVV